MFGTARRYHALNYFILILMKTVTNKNKWLNQSMPCMKDREGEERMKVRKNTFDIVLSFYLF